jgi:hypothetical protein
MKISIIDGFQSLVRNIGFDRAYSKTSRAQLRQNSIDMSFPGHGVINGVVVW